MNMTVLLAAGLGTAAAASADRLIMTNGVEVRGDVTRTSEAYIVTTPSGDDVAYDRDEVRRAEYVSRLTPDDAADQLAALRAMIEPVLDAPEPDQFIFLSDVVRFDDSASATGSSARFDATRSVRRTQFGRDRFGGRSFGTDAFRFDRNRSGTVVSTVERGQTSDDVFVDEWLRYVAPFTAVAQDPRYRALTDPRVHSDALGDFARRAPDRYDAASRAVRDALRALDRCLDLAADTRKRVAALPLLSLSDDEAIRDLELDLERERDRLVTARDYWRQKDRVNRAEDRLRERIVERDNDLIRARRIAERKINEFAHARELTRQLLRAAAAELDRAKSQP